MGGTLSVILRFVRVAHAAVIGAGVSNRPPIVGPSAFYARHRTQSQSDSNWSLSFVIHSAVG